VVGKPGPGADLAPRLRQFRRPAADLIHRERW
jgi:hypothetical protein